MQYYLWLTCTLYKDIQSNHEVYPGLTKGVMPHLYPLKTSEITTQTCRKGCQSDVKHIHFPRFHHFVSYNVFAMFCRPPSAPADSILKSYDRSGPIAAPWMEGAKPCQ